MAIKKTNVSDIDVLTVAGKVEFIQQREVESL